MDITKAATDLDQATSSAVAISQLSATKHFDVETAYRIQAAGIAQRLDRGEKRSGAKMGLTSRAKSAQMGVDDVIYGRLTDAMLVEDGGETAASTLIHPRVEPEIAFLLKAPLSGNVSPAQAYSAVEALAPALEIIDSRYTNFMFSLDDVVADNCSAAGYVVGPWCRPDIDVANLGMVLEFNGRPVQIGSSAAILGHPMRSLAAAARLALASGEQLEAGWIVLAGGATAAEGLAAGTTVRLCVEKLGQVGFAIT